jgi:hypothetical protein
MVKKYFRDIPRVKMRHAHRRHRARAPPACGVVVTATAVQQLSL